MGARHRQRRPSRPSYSEWQEPPSSLQDWRATSPTVRSLKENADRFRVSLEAVRRGLHTARFSAISSGKDAKLRVLQYLKALQRLDSQQSGLAAEKASINRSEEVATDLHKVLKELTSKRDSQSFAAGVLLFGALLFVAGSQPWLLPYAYVAFILVCLPLRCVDFVRRKWTFFLLDFCYWANIATTAFLLFCPGNGRLYTAVNALADGPLAAALIVWQTAWVFGSAAHTISVLIHQLPGLALFALKYYPPPDSIAERLPRTWRHSVAERSSPGFSLFWSLGAPFLFYLGWQLAYFLIVQVLSRRFIKARGYDTSYNCLARRAVKTNNFWNRTVRRGSTLRRVFMFGPPRPRRISPLRLSMFVSSQYSVRAGFIQAIYTVCVLLLLIPISMSFHLTFIWQVVKIVFPIWHGSRYICEKVPRHAVMKVWKQQQQAQYS